MSDSLEIAFRGHAPVSIYNNPFDNIDEAVVDKISKVAKKTWKAWNGTSTRQRFIRNVTYISIAGGFSALGGSMGLPFFTSNLGIVAAVILAAFFGGLGNALSTMLACDTGEVTKLWAGYISHDAKIRQLRRELTHPNNTKAARKAEQQLIFLKRNQKAVRRCIAAIEKRQKTFEDRIALLEIRERALTQLRTNRVEALV